MTIRLSDYVIDFIAREGVKHIFMVSGGSGMFLIDSLGRRNDIQYVCNHHEQASTIAAEAYQRITGNLGVALVTTGPASTNALTGVLCAWNDSLPLLMISGQANSRFLIENTGLRQRGNHEVNITRIVESVTKYAVTVKDENLIQYHLEKAVYLARNGRPGPVWIDIPIDIQGKIIETDNLKHFRYNEEFKPTVYNPENMQIDLVRKMLNNAKRPVFLAGNGIRLCNSTSLFKKLVEKYRIPFVKTKNFFDAIPYDYELCGGMSGTYGQRAANFTIQNSDLVIALGSRLCFSSVGYATDYFAREAKRIVVDIDPNQLKHPHIKIDVGINADIRVFLEALDASLSELNADYSEWISRIQEWKSKFPSVTREIIEQTEYVNSNYFFELLSEEMDKNDILVCDQGSNFYSYSVAFKVKDGQRAFTNGGFSALGYGLPASIGACFANGRKRVVCAHGDGGLQFNIQELQTIIHHKLPIKLFVVNNDGYGSIKNTQTFYFDGFKVGSDSGSGLSCPDTAKIAHAYGFKYLSARDHKSLRHTIQEALSFEGPVIVEIFADPMQAITPRVASERLPDGRMVSKPLEDMTPYLSREDLRKEMIIKPLDE